MTKLVSDLLNMVCISAAITIAWSAITAITLIQDRIRYLF